MTYIKTGSENKRSMMELMSAGETFPDYQEQISRLEEEGEDPSYIKTRRAEQIMGGVEGLLVMKEAYDKGGSPQNYANVPEGATVASERELGSKVIQRWLGQLPSKKHAEFYDLLGKQEGSLRADVWDQQKYSESYSNLRNFLGENLLHSSKMKATSPQKIRRTAEDKIMNGFLQQDNKYKMGK